MMTRYIQSHPPTIQGILWMVYASFWFATMTVLIRIISENLGTFQMVFLRNILCVVLMLPWFIRTGRQHMHPKQPWKLYGYRAISGLIGMWLLFYAIKFVPLSEMVALTFTVPLFTTILAATILKEQVGIHRWMGIIIGFIGVLIILQPGSGDFHFANILVITAALTWSISNIFVKKITTSDPPQMILFIMMLMMAPLSLPTALIDWQPLHMEDLLWVIFLAFTTNQAQGSLIKAYSATEVNAVMPYDFCRLIFVSLLSYIVFGEIIHKTTLIGACVIFGSALYVAHREVKQLRKHGN